MNEKNINEIILFQLDKTSKIAKQYSQSVMDKLDFGLRIEQWVLLKIIHENSPLSQRELATKSLRDPASITRTLDILSKKKFITRLPIPNNRRQYNIELTNVGGTFVEKNMETVKELRSLSVKDFSQEELKMLSNMLLRIQKNMS
jgi:DNA-binding MarR family transcriptional regulator